MYAKWLLPTALIASLVSYALSQDCVYCLTVPCQSTIPQATDSIWTSCLSCLQKGYPLQCPSSSTAASCATLLIGSYSGTDSASCCFAITGTLLRGLQSDVLPSCSAPPSSLTPRSPVGVAPLPYVSSNGQPLQYIIPRMNFSCQGCLQMLNITLMGGVSADSSFYLQLWRRYTAISGQSPVSSDLYQLNTSVLLTISASSGSSSNVYSLAINVCFHEGDTIGIQLPYNSLLRIATDNSSVIYKRDIPAQCTNVVSGIFQPSLNYIGAPLITLIMAPSPSSTFSSPSPTPTISSSSLAAPYQSTVSISSAAVLSPSSPLQTVKASVAADSSVGSRTLVGPLSATAGVVSFFIMMLAVSMLLVLWLRHTGAKSGGHGDTKGPSSHVTQSHGVKSEMELSNDSYQPLEQHTARPPPPKSLTGLPRLLEESSEHSAVSPHPYETITASQRKTEGIYDHPRELELRPMPPFNPYHTLEPPDKRSPALATQLSSVTLASSINSLARDDSTQQANTKPYHVLETTERDPETGNPYHVLEEQLRAQNDQSPKFGVCVPNAVQREHIFKHGEKKWSQVSRTHIERDKKFFNDNGQFWQPASNDVMLYEQLSKHRFREILRDDIIVGDQLGSGAFGTVYKAQWSFPGGKLAVAVKVMKPSIAEGAKVRFLQEAAVMGQFFHPNVVKLHGVVTVGEPPMIVLELMPRGDLSSFLRNCHTPGERPPPTPTFLLLCSRDIACGMKYLTYKGFVHRDLAARNILLTEDLKCKIADFGLSRDLEENPYYITHKGTIPLKWSAPEAITQGKFSTSSDVYSYGMLLYEIWSCGCKPMANTDLMEAKRLVQEGYCQPPPPGCPRGIYEVMVKCWNPEHNYRPSFAEIQEYLSASDDTILAWSSSDREVSPQASVLGAPLSEGAGLYKDLQQTYRQLQITKD